MHNAFRSVRTIPRYNLKVRRGISEAVKTGGLWLMGFGVFGAGSKARHEAVQQQVDALQRSLAGPCFDGLNFLRRMQTYIGIALALKALSGESVRTTIYRLACPKVDVPKARVEPSAAKPSLAELVERSYNRDYISQRARIALLQASPEAGDDEVDEAFVFEDLSPALTELRQRLSVRRLQSV